MADLRARADDEFSAKFEDFLHQKKLSMQQAILKGLTLLMEAAQAGPFADLTSSEERILLGVRDILRNPSPEAKAHQQIIKVLVSVRKK
jgi:hypothetical protein